MSDDLDPLALLTRYAPTQARLSAEWDDVRPAHLVERAVAEDEAIALVALAPRGRPRGHRLLRLPAAASIAALIVAAGALVFALASPGGPSRTALGQQHGRYFTPPPGLSGKPLGTDQYAYAVTRHSFLDDRTGASVHGVPGTSRTATYPDLSWVGLDSKGRPTVCAGSGGSAASLTNATRSYLLTLPTDYRALSRYLIKHTTPPMKVSTVIEGLFGRSDGLASVRLRAALLAVLSRQPHVKTDWTAVDDLGRAALRFTVDGADSTTVLYFDPRNFHRLESRFEYKRTTERNITVQLRAADDRPGIQDLCHKGGH